MATWQAQTAAEVRGSRRDTFADDADLLEVEQVHLEGGAGSGPSADQSHLLEAEHGLQEYLLFGQGGQVFSNSPTSALGAEDRGWSGGGGSMFGSYAHRKRLSEYLWWLYSVGDPTARNAVNIYTYFLVGGGCNVSFGDADDDKRWQSVSRRVQWRLRERQIVKGAVLFGETFARIWPSMTSNRTNTPAGELKVRVLNTFDISDIKTAPGDPETVLSYLQPMPGLDPIPHRPEDMVHFTLDTIPGNVRGHPLLLPVLQPLYYYRSFLSNRHWLNAVRSRVPLILSRKHGGAEGLNKLRTAYSRLPAPGTVWALPASVTADFPQLNIGAADVSADAKQMLRTVAMGLGLPEFLLTADASNANYSSSVVAEAPAMQMFRDLQGVLGPSLADLIGRLIGRAPLDFEGIEVTFPSVERNLLQLVQSLSVMFGDGILSRRSYAERAGFRWEGTEGELARLDRDGGFGDRPEGAGANPPGPSPGARGADPGTGRSTPPGMGGQSAEDP